MTHYCPMTNVTYERRPNCPKWAVKYYRTADPEGGRFDGTEILVDVRREHPCTIIKNNHCLLCNGKL